MVQSGQCNHRAGHCHLAIYPGSSELFGSVYSTRLNEVREARTARCEGTYSKKMSIFTVNKAIKAFVRGLPQAYSLMFLGALT